VHCDTAPPNGLIGISGKAGTRTWSYDEGDDYTFSLAATTDADTLALSLYVAGPGWADLLLNTDSNAATVDRASRVAPAIPYAQSLAISPDGATLYACISDGRTGTLAAYNARTGKLLKVLHRWTLATARIYFCQVSADATAVDRIAALSKARPVHGRHRGLLPRARADLPRDHLGNFACGRQPGALLGATTGHGATNDGLRCVVTARRDAEVADYVHARLSWLRLIAFRLCRDWQRGDDLVQATITELYVRWDRASAAEHIDAYARTILTRK
jgi:hypothetical protein